MLSVLFETAFRLRTFRSYVWAFLLIFSFLLYRVVVFSFLPPDVSDVYDIHYKLVFLCVVTVATSSPTFKVGHTMMQTRANNVANGRKISYNESQVSFFLIAVAKFNSRKHCDLVGSDVTGDSSGKCTMKTTSPARLDIKVARLTYATFPSTMEDRANGKVLKPSSRWKCWVVTMVLDKSS